MGQLLEKFKEIDNNLEQEINRITNEEERRKKEKDREKISLERKFKEIINFINNSDNTMSNLSPDDYAVENGAAYVVAKNVKDKMKINQLRKFFTRIKSIDNEIRMKKEDNNFDASKTVVLLPELAYAYGRGLITREFYDLMKICLSETKIKTVKDFKRLVDFLSAVLAYHKMLSK
ncbi:MAG: type III-A CRISPR-associated protein Csm2 [Candidatus Anstonellales archaeon]